MASSAPPSQRSRRARYLRAAWTVPAACLALASLQGQTTNTIRAQSLGVADNLYLLSGSGGNALMMTADTGTVLVDTGSAASAAQLTEIASTLSDRPVTTVIYTHAHADHTGGASGLTDRPRIIAHERTQAAMRQAGLPPSVTPSVSFADTLSLFDGPDRVELYYAGPGHTSGDAIVIFPGKRIAYIGDLFPGKMLPVVDRELGGSYVALPDTLTRAAIRLAGVTRVIPGHAAPPPGSPLGRWMTTADLQEYADFTRDLVAAVRAGLRAGRSTDDLAADLGLHARYARYDMTNARQVIQQIADEVGR
jgi:glyoxylase-like metal-dependent hydrolase (beta-lactamase superfamily II)